MKKFFFIIIFFPVILLSTDCISYYNPKKFYEAPEALVELLDKTFENEIFSDKDFKNKILINNETIKKNSYVKHGEFIYPINSGFWKFKRKNNKLDEVNIARVEIYRFSDIDIANTVNDDFDNYWNDYIENAYEMQLTPEQTLFRYNNTYFTMSVFIYGIKGDSTPLKGTVVNFWLKDYTKEVNTYIQCIKGKNDS